MHAAYPGRISSTRLRHSCLSAFSSKSRWTRIDDRKKLWQFQFKCRQSSAAQWRHSSVVTHGINTTLSMSNMKDSYLPKVKAAVGHEKLSVLIDIFRNSKGLPPGVAAARYRANHPVCLVLSRFLHCWPFAVPVPAPLVLFVFGSPPLLLLNRRDPAKTGRSSTYRKNGAEYVQWKLYARPDLVVNDIENRSLLLPTLAAAHRHHEQHPAHLRAPHRAPWVPSHLDRLRQSCAECRCAVTTGDSSDCAGTVPRHLRHAVPGRDSAE